MPRKVFFLCASLALVSFLFLLPLDRAFADNQGPTIHGKMTGLLAKTSALGENLDSFCDKTCDSSPASNRFRQRVERIKQTNSRASNAHGRTNGDDYQELLRRRGKKKDANCDPNFQVCGSSGSSSSSLLAANPNDEEFDNDSGAELGQELDEVGAEIDALNSILAGYQVPTPDVELEDADYFFPASMQPSSEVMFGAFLANLAAEKAAAIATHFCDQTAVALGFGGNASAACSVVEGIYQVLNAVYQVMDYISQDAMSAEVTGTYKRARNIFDQLVIADNKGDQTNALVIELHTRVTNMEQQLINLQGKLNTALELLRTPQGQRAGFPQK